MPSGDGELSIGQAPAEQTSDRALRAGAWPLALPLLGTFASPGHPWLTSNVEPFGARVSFNHKVSLRLARQTRLSAKEFTMLSRSTFSRIRWFGFAVLSLVALPLVLLAAAGAAAGGDDYKPHYAVNPKNPRVFFEIT